MMSHTVPMIRSLVSSSPLPPGSDHDHNDYTDERHIVGMARFCLAAKSFLDRKACPLPSHVRPHPAIVLNR